jgi:hypothetical protein
MRVIALAAVGLAVVSCGGGSASNIGSATLTGSTVGGQAIVANDAIATTVSLKANDVPGRAALIGITSASGICPMIMSGKQPKSTQVLSLTAFHLQPDFSPTPPPAAGTYSVGALVIDHAVGLFAATDASCNVLSPPGVVQASSGTVTFTSVGSRYAGSFELSFGFGEHVTGTFDAPVCPVNESATLACR